MRGISLAGSKVKVMCQLSGSMRGSSWKHCLCFVRSLSQPIRTASSVHYSPVLCQLHVLKTIWAQEFRAHTHTSGEVGVDGGSQPATGCAEGWQSAPTSNEINSEVAVQLWGPLTIWSLEVLREPEFHCFWCPSPATRSGQSLLQRGLFESKEWVSFSKMSSCLSWILYSVSPRAMFYLSVFKGQWHSRTAIVIELLFSNSYLIYKTGRE